jgi:hypothetical protein
LSQVTAERNALAATNAQLHERHAADEKKIADLDQTVENLQHARGWLWAERREVARFCNYQLDDANEPLKNAVTAKVADLERRLAETVRQFHVQASEHQRHWKDLLSRTGCSLPEQAWPAIAELRRKAELWDHAISDEGWGLDGEQLEAELAKRKAAKPNPLGSDAECQPAPEPPACPKCGASGSMVHPYSEKRWWCVSCEEPWLKAEGGA